MRTGDVEGLLAEIMGKSTGVCGVVGGSQHLTAENYYSNGIQGGMTPVAAGRVLAAKMEQKGGITTVFIGDRTLGQGVLYETLNIASAWNLPLMVVLENNRYAQSSPAETLHRLQGSARTRPSGVVVAGRIGFNGQGHTQRRGLHGRRSEKTFALRGGKPRQIAQKPGGEARRAQRNRVDGGHAVCQTSWHRHEARRIIRRGREKDHCELNRRSVVVFRHGRVVT